MQNSMSMRQGWRSALSSISQTWIKPLLLVSVLLLAILLGGVLATDFRIFLFAGIIGIVGMFGLLYFPGISLALSLVGFPLYLLLFNFLGLSTESQTTITYYLVLAVTGLLGAVQQNPQGFHRVKHKTILFWVFSGWLVLNWLLLSFDNSYALTRIMLMVLLVILPFISTLLLLRKQLLLMAVATIVFNSFSLLMTGQRLLTSSNSLLGTRFSVTAVERAGKVAEFNPLWFAYILAVGMIFAWSWVLTRTQRSLLVWLIVATYTVTATAMMLATGSRGPLIAIALVALFIFLTSGFRYRLQLALILASLIVLFLFLSRSSIDLYGLGRLAQTFDVRQTVRQNDFSALDDISANRLTLWIVAWQVWLEHPILGVGLGNFPGLFPHNFIMETLAEYGLIGFVIFSAFVSVLVKAARRLFANARSDSLSLAAICLLIFSFVQISFSGNLQNSVTFWISCGLLLNLVCNQLPMQNTRQAKPI